MDRLAAARRSSSCFLASTSSDENRSLLMLLGLAEVELESMAMLMSSVFELFVYFMRVVKFLLNILYEAERSSFSTCCSGLLLVPLFGLASFGSVELVVDMFISFIFVLIFFFGLLLK